MSAISVVLILAAYGAAIVAAGAVLAWGLLRRVGGFSSSAAALVAVMVWVAAMAPPVAGLVGDILRAPVKCDPEDECYDYILWWLSIPVGWLLSVVTLALAVYLGRRRTRSSEP